MSKLPITALQKLQISQERTREWISGLSDTKLEDDLESIAESSIVDSGDETCDVCDYTTDTEGSTVPLGAQMPSNKVTVITETIRELMNSINSVQTVGNVNISNSTNVHIGNVTNINGNIQIIADAPPSPSNSPRSRRNGTRKENRRVHKPANTSKSHVDEEYEERAREDAFITKHKYKVPSELDFISPRHSWLAQKALEEYQPLKEPVEYVVILHTATESSEKRATNIGLIRDIQCFHIETRGWNDIAYNFLIGCDAQIYEGRGWGNVGAHTRGYNFKSIGIAFIGCFMRELPTPAALRLCKNLLARGVKEGHIAADYKLVCHCQCNSTQSPGRRLFEEIQTWDHFHNLEEE